MPTVDQSAYAVLDRTNRTVNSDNNKPRIHDVASAHLQLHAPLREAIDSRSCD